MAGKLLSERIAGLPASRQEDSLTLDALFRDITGWRPRLWGKTIGYGIYHYRTKSGLEGEWFATGFAPLASKFSIYVLPGYSEFSSIAARLGPHSRGKACWYVKRLDVIDLDVLAELIRAGLDDLAGHVSVRPT
ncbi:MAG: DUF1801 domain-containing protein [Pseudomonadota bacterium]